MQTEVTRSIHEGRNVKRIREILGIKQEALAVELGISQQAISALEQRETLDRDTLDRVAKLLKVSPEAIKNYDDEKAVNIIASNYNGTDNSSAVNFQCTFNPLDKLMEAIEENKQLYERLLKAEMEKNVLLEKMLEIKS
jgi:transcriptional regulator with XRE-family HTH domain